MPTWTVETPIAAPVERCFALSLSVEAHTDSMEGSGERAVGGTTSGELRLGDTVTWRARHFGVWFSMTSRITAYERPTRFVDEQTSGPFARWWHEHEFVSIDRPDVESIKTTGGTAAAAQSSTLMIDRITFEAPFGILGRTAERVALTRYMRLLIRRRNDWLRRELEREAAGGQSER